MRGGIPSFCNELLFASVAYHLAKFDHLVFLAAVDHALGHEQAGKLALAVFHVLSGDEHAGPQQHARLAGRLAAVAEEYAGLAARAAAQAQLHQLCRFGDGLYADRTLLRNFALKAAYHAEHPVVAALGLQAEQTADFQPVPLDFRDAGAEAAGADILHDPGFRARGIGGAGAAEHRQHSVVAVGDIEARLHPMALMFSLRRLGRPVQGQVVEHVEHGFGRIGAAAVSYTHLTLPTIYSV